MKCRILCFFLFLASLQALGQQEYFIYLQSNNSQAFYVKLNNKIYSSAASGYLIIPKLADSSYTITIGFAGNQFPEQEFIIPISRKDAGFTLSNMGEKGWGLLNIQTLAVIMNTHTLQEKKSPEVTGNKSNNSFAMLLANAVNDTTVLYTVSRPKPPAPVIKEEEKKDSVASVKKDDVKKDTQSIAKVNAPKKGSPVPVAKNNKGRKNNAIIPVKNNAVKTDTTAIASTNTPVKDSAINRRKLPAGKNGLKKDSSVVTKTTAPAKDSINVLRKLSKKDSLALVKNSRVKNKNLVTAPKKPYTNAQLDSIIKRNIAKTDSIVNARKNLASKTDTVAIVKTIPEKSKDSAALVKTFIPQKDEPAVTITPTKTDSVTGIKPGNEIKRTRPLVNKAAEILTDTSYVAVFIDESKEKFDTIRISIPFKEIVMVKKEEKPVQKELVMIDSPAPKINIDTIHVVTNVIKETPAVKKDSVVIPVKTDTVAQTPRPKPEMINSDCKETAWDSDIDKLRIKMLLLKTTEEKIALARKVYTQKCFTVKQVKALSELFDTDEGKYKWCDAVYSYVTDSSNFGSLAELFKEVYYLNRFKAMLRN